MSQFDIFLDYWRSLPCEAGCDIPRKSAFNPADVKKLLPCITIHERLGRCDMRCRLTGTAIDEMFGRNFTGINLFDLYDPADHDFFAGLHDNMLNIPCGSRAWRHVLMPDGEHFIIESLHLPMANDAGERIYLITLMLPQAEYAPEQTAAHETSMATLEKTVEYLDLGFGLPQAS